MGENPLSQLGPTLVQLAELFARRLDQQEARAQEERKAIAELAKQERDAKAAFEQRRFEQEQIIAYVTYTRTAIAGAVAVSSP